MTIKLNAETGGGSVSLSAPSSTTSNLDVELTLPVDDGAANTFLKSDGSGTLSWAAAASDNITEGNTTVECVDTGSDGHITFDTEGSEAARFDSDGRLLVNATSSQTWSGGAPLVQVSGTSASGTMHFGAFQYSNSSDGGELVLGSSRGTTVGSTTVVQNGDTLGRIRFCAADGSDLTNRGGEITCQIDGTPGSNDIPTRMMFYTASDGAGSPTERMRIDSSGFVKIGTPVSPSGSASSTGFSFMEGSNMTWSTTGGNGYWNVSVDTSWNFRRNGTQVGSIFIGGSSTTYNTSSDYRMKENVVDLDGAITRVKQLAPKRFNFIAAPEKTVDGFLAHEAQTVVPEAVTGTHNEVEVWTVDDKLPDGVSVGDNKLDEDGNTIPKYQGIDQAKLVPLLTAALQEAIGKIEALETANASLEARLTALEGGAS